MLVQVIGGTMTYTSYTWIYCETTRPRGNLKISLPCSYSRHMISTAMIVVLK